MPILEAEAVVLRRYSLSEADRIVVLATREFGSVRVIAQGVKKPKSRMAGCLEPLNHIRAKFFLREGAELWRLRQCETLHSFLGRNPSLTRLYGFSYVAELMQEFLDEHNANPPLFRLLLATLEAGEEFECDEALIRYFELWLLRLSGLLPDYCSCSQCGGCVTDLGFYALVEAGQSLCAACSGSKGVRIQAEAAAALRDLPRMSPAQFVSRGLPGRAAHDLGRLTQRILEWSLGKPLRSYPALRQIWGREQGP
jgi:DNA repair protein RecO (recombination protein O)